MLVSAVFLLASHFRDIQTGNLKSPAGIVLFFFCCCCFVFLTISGWRGHQTFCEHCFKSHWALTPFENS